MVTFCLLSLFSFYFMRACLVILVCVLIIVNDTLYRLVLLSFSEGCWFLLRQGVNLARPKSKSVFLAGDSSWNFCSVLFIFLLLLFAGFFEVSLIHTQLPGWAEMWKSSSVAAYFIGSIPSYSAASSVLNPTFQLLWPARLVLCIGASCPSMVGWGGNTEGKPHKKISLSAGSSFQFLSTTDHSPATSNS